MTTPRSGSRVDLRAQHGGCPLGSQLKVATIGLLVAVGIGCGSAHADIPELQMMWWVNGDLVQGGVLAGSDNGDGTFDYDGFVVGGGAKLNYDFTADPDPLISANLVVENITKDTINVRLLVILPIAPTLPNGSGIMGSAAIGMTASPDGGLLATLVDTPLWQGLIDGAVVASAVIFAAPFDLEVPLGGIGSVGDAGSFGSVANPLPGPPVLNTIGIEINFSLTSGDQASLTSVFNVLPTPGGLTVLLGAVWIGRRRRRRT